MTFYSSKSPQDAPHHADDFARPSSAAQMGMVGNPKSHAAARFSHRKRDAGVIAPALGGFGRPFIHSVAASPLCNVERPGRWSLPSQPAGATIQEPCAGHARSGYGGAATSAAASAVAILLGAA